MRVRIDERTIREFAEISGDFNSQHIDPQFAADSAYARNIAHGVIGLSLLFCRLPKGSQLSSLSVMFRSPIFAGDELDITLRINPEQTKGTFEIIKIDKRAVCTRGTFTLSVSEAPFNRGEFKGKPSLITKRLSESRCHLADLKEGQTETCHFSLGRSVVDRCFEFFGKIDFEIDEHVRSWIPEFLFVSSLSTFVGMCLPGRWTTFLSLDIQFKRQIFFRSDYKLVGRISVLSKSTGTLTEDLKITDEGGNEFAVASTIAKVASPKAETVMMDTLQIDYGLKGRVAIVTGSSRGVGAAIAKALASHRAKIVINYLNHGADASKVVADIEKAGAQAIAVKADISTREGVNDLVQQASSKFGRIDILVCNAVRDTRPIPFEETRWEDVQDDLDMILQSSFNAAQSVLPYFRKQGSGKIIQISTTFTDAPVVRQTKYITAKTALEGLTRSLAIELAPYNVQVNAIVPSLIETDLTRNLSPSFIESVKLQTPLGRNCEVTDVAYLAAFLASNQSNFITGQRIVVAGGNLPLL